MRCSIPLEIAQAQYGVPTGGHVRLGLTLDQILLFHEDVS